MSQPDIKELKQSYRRFVGDLNYSDAVDYARIIGWEYMQTQDYDQALSWFLREIDCCQDIADPVRAKVQEAGARRFIGVIRMNMGQYSLAKDQHSIALRLAREYGDPFEEANALLNLALVSETECKEAEEETTSSQEEDRKTRLHTFEQCLKRYGQCVDVASRARECLGRNELELRKSYGDTICDALYDHGALLEYLERYEEALDKHFDASETIGTEDTFRLVRCYRSVALCCSKLGRMSRASQYFKQAYTTASPDTEQQLDICIDWAEHYEEHGRKSDALKYFGKAKHLAKELKDTERVRALAEVIAELSESENVSEENPVKRRTVLQETCDNSAKEKEHECATNAVKKAKVVPSQDKFIRYKFRVRDVTFMLAIPVGLGEKSTVQSVINECNRRCALRFRDSPPVVVAIAFEGSELDESELIWRLVPRDGSFLEALLQ